MAVTTELPRLAHVQAHLTYSEQQWLPYLLAPVPLKDVAALRGPGYTRRMAEYAAESLRQMFAPDVANAFKTVYARLAVMRIAAGIDPCWCEMSTSRTPEYSPVVRRLVGNSLEDHKNAPDNGWSPARHPTTAGGVPVTLQRVAR